MNLLFLLLGLPLAFAQPEKCDEVLVMPGHYIAQYLSPEQKARYTREMDHIAKQKVALLALMMANEGLFADWGSGSGYTTWLISKMFPRLSVVGIDINPDMVQGAREMYSGDNVHHIQGNIAKPNHPPKSLAGGFCCASNHHVNSFEGTGYSIHEVIAAIGTQIEQIQLGGMWASNDFTIAKGPARVYLSLPNNNGSQNLHDPIESLSTAALFKKFAIDFQSSVHRNGVTYEQLPATEPNTERFHIDYRTAIEFLLHKDYRNSWKTEIQEEYLYMSQNQFDSVLKLHNMRILALRPIYNHWIYVNRLMNQYVMTDERGNVLPRFPTKLLAAAQRVGPEAGVLLREEWFDTVRPTYLKLSHFRNQSSDEVYDVVSRPHPTVDVIPYFEEEGQVYVISRAAYPRPILNAHLPVPHLTDVSTGGYIPEPITFVVRDREELLPSALSGLQKRTSIPVKNRNRAFLGAPYYPSPGGIAEKVTPVTVQVDSSIRSEMKAVPQPPFAESGELRSTEATNVLVAHHVGGAFDARLELNVYRLLKHLGRDTGMWFGYAVDLADQQASFKPYRWAKKPKARVDWVATDRSAGFLQVRRGHFVELNSVGNQNAAIDLEYVVPSQLTHHTVLTLPVAKVNGEVWVGLEERSLPVPQMFGDSSRLLTSPAFRLPLGKRVLDTAEPYALQRLTDEFGAQVKGMLTPLGMDFRVSPGTTPEIVYPYVVEVAPSLKDRLRWVKLSELMSREKNLSDMQLLIAIFRLNHALKESQ